MKHKRLPVRFQLMLMYLLVICAVAASFLPLSGAVRGRLLRNYKRDLELRFAQSVTALEDSIRQIYWIPDMLSAYPDYREALMAIGPEGLHDALPKFFMTARLVNKYITAIPMADSVFLSFIRSGAVIDGAQLYLSQEEFSQFGVSVKSADPNVMSAMLTSKRQYYRLSAISLRGTAAREGMLLFIDRPYTNVRIGAVFHERTLLDAFHMDVLPSGCLQLCDAEGQEVYRTGTIGDGSAALEYSIRYTNLTVRLFVPGSYYDGLLSGFDSLLRQTVLIAFGVGLLVSGILTLINYQPVRKLLHLSGKARSAGNNEYALLYEHMRESESRLDGLHENVRELTERLRESLFARLLNGAVHSAEETELSWRMFPQLARKNRLALVRIVSPTEETEPKAHILTFLDTLKQVGAYWQPCALNEAAVLLPADDAATDGLRALLMREGTELAKSGMRPEAGLSAPFDGTTGMYLARHQADIALAKQETLTEFVPNAGEMTYPFMELVTLQRFYELLIAGEGDAAADIIAESGEKLLRRGTSDDARIEYCGLIRFSMDAVRGDLKLPVAETVPMQELLRLTPEALLRRLTEEVKELAESVNRTKSRPGQENRERVMDYIRKNFASPSVYADSIAEATGVSANTVYQIARECTGRSLGDYIESLRLDMACRLLRTTGNAVMDIAEKCGWTHPATFYRVFKQKIGVPPAQYRKQNAQKRE